MTNYTLGTLEASEALIRDLYIELRSKVNFWSKITFQTPQARMGYVGQHLVSVVTGFRGGKSGARGYDLIMNDNNYGEIKTCYRVDQLGSCLNCGAVVSSLESECSACGSHNIARKDDSKWLINIRNDSEFVKIIEPKRYYFVLFEFADLHNSQNNNIEATIWEVDPLSKGFSFCMIDYYLNIRSKSPSNAPFDMWPHKIKFALTNPTLIYKSIIKDDGSIQTIIFPTMNNSYNDELEPLTKYSQTRTVTINAVKNVISRLVNVNTSLTTKHKCLEFLETKRKENNISNKLLCDTFADEIYLPLIYPLKDRIPQQIRRHFSELI